MSQLIALGKVVAVFAVCIGVVSCGGGGAGSTASSNSGGTVSGSAAKGIIQNGIVTLRDAAGAQLQTTTSPVRTGVNGSYSAVLSNPAYSGPVFVEITADGTTLIQNEVTGAFESAGGLSTTLLKSVGNVSAGQAVSINATPLTSIVADLVERSRGSGNASTLLVQQAQVAITTTLGFNPVTTKPVNPRDSASASESTEVKKQAIILAALAQLGTDPGNTTCSGEATTAAKLICASNQLRSAYVGTTINNNQIRVLIDGTKIDGLVNAINIVSANADINKTGSTIDPATDPSTDEIEEADRTDSTTETTVEAPPQGFNDTDVAAVKTLFNNLRSNAAALGNGELNGPLETQLANFADSVSSQATGLEPGPFGIVEATATGIELWATHQAAASRNLQTERPVFFSAGPATCAVLASVGRNQEQVVTSAVLANSSGANNAAFVSCTVFGDSVSRPDGSGLLELRNYTLMTPTSTTNTFNVESDSRFCDTDFTQSSSGDACLALSGNSRLIGSVLGANVATASGNKTLDSTGNITSSTGSFSGMVVPPVEFDFSNSSAPTAVELAETTNLDLQFTANFPNANSIALTGRGSVTTTSTGQTITTELSSFSANGSKDSNTREVVGSFSAQGRVATQLGALRGAFSIDSNAGRIEFTGAVDLRNGSSTATLFEGAVTLSGAPATETASATASVLFDGTLRLPERPELLVELQVNNASQNNTTGDFESGSIAFTYQQNGTTVILNASRNAQGVESITINSPTSMVTVGPFNPDSVQTVDVLRDGRLAARYNVADTRVNYVDGTFEQF